MEFDQLLEERYSVRKFSDQKVEKEKIDKEFQQRKNILDEEYQKLRRNYASTNE